MTETGELRIIMKAKDLTSYVMSATQKSPKVYRFTYTSRLQNLSMEILAQIYRANDIYVGSMEELDARNRCFKRLELQYKIVTDTRMLAYMAQLSLEQKVITHKQYQQISRMSTDVIQLSMGWIKGDKKRLGLL